MLLICKYCKTEFHRQYKDPYCSYECEVRFSDKEKKILHKKVCIVCDKGFTTPYKTVRYCSEYCEQLPISERKALTLQVKFNVLHRDGFRCHYCGNSPHNNSDCVLHIDHMKPLSKGGKTTMDNLITSCGNCNMGKSNRHDTTAAIEALESS